MPSPYVTFAEAKEMLHAVQVSPKEWTATCPRHPDATQSLHIGEGFDGRL